MITIIAKNSQKLHENHRKGYSNIQKFGNEENLTFGVEERVQFLFPSSKRNQKSGQNIDKMSRCSTKTL